MHRKFITLILAASMAVTGLSAAPARADAEDAAKVIAGVAAIAILGAAIAKSKDDDRHVTRNRGHIRHDRHRGPGRQWNNRHRGNKHARPLPNRVQRKLLPGSCRVTARRGNGQNLRGFGRHCLTRNYGFTNSLPRACQTRVRARNGAPRTIYRGRCLQKHGYSVAHRR